MDSPSLFSRFAARWSVLSAPKKVAVVAGGVTIVSVIYVLITYILGLQGPEKITITDSPYARYGSLRDEGLEIDSQTQGQIGGLLVTFEYEATGPPFQQLDVQWEVVRLPGNQVARLGDPAGTLVPADGLGRTEFPGPKTTGEGQVWIRLPEGRGTYEVKIFLLVGGQRKDHDTLERVRCRSADSCVAG